MVQSSKAAFNALKLLFKNCKAAVQCPAGFQCSGAEALSPLRYESVSKEPSAKQQSCVQCDEVAVQSPADGSKVLEPGDDIVEDLFRDGLLDIAIFCGSTRLGMLEQVVEARVLFVEAPLRLPPVGGGG